MLLNNQPETGLRERVLQVFKYTGLNQGIFAEKIGISGTFFSDIKRGIKDPGLNVVSGILYAFVEISAEWLLRGNGEMLVQNTATGQGDISPDEKIYILELENKIEKLEMEVSYLKKIIALLQKGENPDNILYRWFG